MQKIKVTYVINDLLIGGGQRIIGDIAKYLDKDQFEVSVLSLRDYRGSGKNTFDNFFLERGIAVTHLSTNKPGKLSLFFSILKVLKQQKPDILHTLLPDAVIYGTFAGRFSGVNKIIIHEMNRHAFLTKKLDLFFELARKLSRLSIFYSETFEREYFPTAHHLYEPITQLKTRSCTIYNGVDIETVEKVKTQTGRDVIRAKFGVAPHEIMIFCAARLIPWKGYDLLIKAFSELVQEGFSNIKLVIAGDGPLRDELQKMLDENPQVKNASTLLGARSDVFEIMVASDIFSLAIEWPKGAESISLGMSSMESMAFSLPSVASDYADQYAGIKDRENVMLVKPGNVESLKQALKYLIENKLERERIGNNASAYIDKYFNSPKNSKIYASIYKTLAQE